MAEIRKRDAIDGHRAFACIDTAAKKPDLARKEYADMLKEQPASARAHYFFGIYLMLTEKNYKSASDEFEAAIRLDPSYLPAYFRIGHAAALAANNFARGEETLKNYLAYGRKKMSRPSSRAPTIGSVKFTRSRGRKAEARSNYAASLKINPNQKDVDAAMKRIS